MKNKLLWISLIILVFLLKLTPIFSYGIAQKYIKKNDYQKAYPFIKTAYSFNKKNQDYRYYYVLSMTNLSPSLDIQKELFLMSKDTLKDSAQNLAEIKISKWRQNLLYNIGDNYIEQAPFEKGVLRWDKFPLKIVIINKSNENLPSYYKTEILRAFAQWQTSTGFVKFVTTNKKSDAQISVTIMQLPQNVCKGNQCKYVIGHTTPDYSGKILKKMNIVLYSKDPLGNFFSDKELYNTILHEIGHALGIMGHSYNSGDLMYMAADNNKFYSQYRSSFQYLSSKDINTIKLLYKLTPNITNSNKINTKGLIYAPIVLGTSKEISMRKLKEAKNYVKNAPKLPGGYIDLGIAYSELNKYSQAIKAMQKAYELSSTDNEKYMSAYNLAIIYLNSGDKDNALKSAQIAKQISNTEEINNLINQIKYH